MHRLDKLVYGGIAGCCAKSCLAPIERVRIMQQVGSTRLGLLAALRNIRRTEGVAGLWAGNSAALIKVFPQRGIAFATNDALGDALGRTHSAAGFVAGGGAGFVACAATYPLDLARGRLAAGGVPGQNLFTVLVTATRQRSLYNGATPTLLGAIPFDGIRFGVVAFLEKRHRAIHESRPDTLTKASHGAIAGIVAGVTTFPNDTIRRCLQQPRFDDTGFFAVARALFREGGLKRFYRGIIPNLVKAAPATAIQFSIFEFLKTNRAFASLLAAEP
ncbi:mitochondrial carrier domain-containing protein [Pelagophyceae sp. CCMP2097]|nr:mitochondrial carrier domain-containing protein [Pelagophyceae sp. CCMP2097]